MSEVHHAGYCATGQRKYLKGRVENWREYLKNGMPVEDLRAINPAMVAHILKLREARSGEET